MAKQKAFVRASEYTFVASKYLESFVSKGPPALGGNLVPSELEVKRERVATSLAQRP
jgi:hypothetical protein